MIAPTPGLDPALEQVYRSAVYEIDCGDGRLIRRQIDRIDAQADAVLGQCGCQRSWSIVTPCNPHSVALDAAENRRRLLIMRADLLTAAWHFLDAVNYPATGISSSDWIEPGFCILDQEPEQILGLAVRYQQNAVVFGRLGDAPHLLAVDFKI
ncbi:DUF3293 domain-containing protein [Sinimarinibacterium sp. CAU 1509]|uniref:DUF3293 domain-containing protein n=1 Tax=Sinimarinibacterium sp. CAU 1509 TaxID=2562283 RepID=UPI0010ABB311|nr:DUF3293 domain-containing protein [Sinimarinibacterium sp. CAU 1509]TJY60899.1 DUF3293 domain-containing protein [Sinimarinibacterium sp. CAU 1509]